MQEIWSVTSVKGSFDPKRLYHRSWNPPQRSQRSKMRNTMCMTPVIKISKLGECRDSEWVVVRGLGSQEQHRAPDDLRFLRFSLFCCAGSKWTRACIFMKMFTLNSQSIIFQINTVFSFQIRFEFWESLLGYIDQNVNRALNAALGALERDF